MTAQRLEDGRILIRAPGKSAAIFNTDEIDRLARFACNKATLQRFPMAPKSPLAARRATKPPSAMQWTPALGVRHVCIFANHAVVKGAGAYAAVGWASNKEVGESQVPYAFRESHGWRELTM